MVKGMAYIDNVEDCVVVSRGRDTERALEGARKQALKYIEEEHHGTVEIDTERLPKASYLHRDEDHCEHEGWEWAIDSYSVSKEPVWLFYVFTKEED